MPLTSEQLDVLRSVPIGEMPNRLGIAFALHRVKRADVAEEIGIAQSALSGYITGNHSSFPLEHARRLAEYFGCQLDDLFPSREDAA